MQHNLVSLSGPDGTKVGNDLPVEMAVIMSSESSKVAVCPPQVNDLPTMGKQYRDNNGIYNGN